MNDLKCWICRRTAQEVYSDYEKIFDTHKTPDQDGMIDSMVFECANDEDKKTLVAIRNIEGSRLPVCDICAELMVDYTTTRIIEDLDSGWQIYDQLKETVLFIIRELVTEAMKEKKGGESET